MFLDGLWLKRSWGGEVRNVSLLVAIDVNDEGFREVLAVAEGSKEHKASGNIAVGKFAPKTSVKKVRVLQICFPLSKTKCDHVTVE